MRQYLIVGYFSGFLALVAGCASVPLADVQYACQVAQATGPVLVAIADASGAPVDTSKVALADLEATCAVIDAVPVAVPAQSGMPTAAKSPRTVALRHAS